MKQMTLVEYDELLDHAVSMGYILDRAIRILSDDDVPPRHGVGTYEISKEDILKDEYKYWSENSKQIVLSFIEKHNLKEFLLR